LSEIESKFPTNSSVTTSHSPLYKYVRVLLGNTIDRLTPHKDGDLISGVSQAVSDLTDEGGIYCVIHLLDSEAVFLHLHCFRHQTGQTVGQHSDNMIATFQLKRHKARFTLQLILAKNQPLRQEEPI